MKRALLAIAALSLCRAAPPVVSRVEPPDWVTPRHDTTIRLLLSGRNLAGAQVKPCDSLHAGKATASHNGSYLFVDLWVPAGARPGRCSLRVSSEEGETLAPFAIAPRLAGGRQGFSPDDVIYLIMPDRFDDGDPSNDDPAISHGMFDRGKARYYHGGDLEGVRQRLPYLRNLGVTAIWLTPIYDNANHLNEREKYNGQAITDYHGYGAVDFYAVDEHLGTLASYRQLIAEAHRLGIKVIQDEVANHTGPYHPWVSDPPTPHWFNGLDIDHLTNTWQTWTILDPHATTALRRSTLDGWFANILPDLNQDNPEVARYLIQNTLWWIGRTGLDGIREDTVPYVPRTFWRQWTGAIHREFPAVKVVGEVFDGDPALVSFFQGGRAGFDGVDTGIDTVFDFPLYYAVRNVFAHHASPAELARVGAHDALYPDASRLVTFLGLHDVARFMNEEGASMDDLARAFTFLFAFRGTPMIYYGDEIGMPGGNDPDNRRDFPGGWPGDARNAFEAAGRSADENRLFDRIRLLAGLRRHSEALRRGRLADLLSNEHAYAFARIAGDDCAIAIFHEGAEGETLRIPVSATGLADGARLEDALGALPPVQVSNGSVEVRMPARAAGLYMLR
ncbi:MAG: alpha-amylase family glycosyl hydrolase [Bryobacteraceae bacterium]|jgi:glycosidase